MKNMLFDTLLKIHLCSSKLLMQGEKQLNSNLWHVTTTAPCQIPSVYVSFSILPKEN